MKKLLLILPLIALLVFTGASCTDEDQENGQGGELSGDIPQLVLDEGQTLTIVSDDWSDIEDPQAAEQLEGNEETLSEDEWKGDPAQILKELYFSGTVSGQVKNQAHHLTGLGAELRGIMVVYQDGSIGGTGEINYDGGAYDCVEDMADGVWVTCDYESRQNGTFNITGDVVLTENNACAFSREWAGNENYRYKVFFLHENQPTETVIYMNHTTDIPVSVPNYEMHQVLYAGLFGQWHLICPNPYVSDLLTLSSHYADGTVDIQFTDDFGQFQDLREKMGLTVQ